MRIAHSSLKKQIELIKNKLLNADFFVPFLLNEETLIFPCESNEKSYLVVSANKKTPLIYLLDEVNFPHFSSLNNTFIEILKSRIAKSTLLSIELKEDDYIIDLELENIETEQIYNIHFEMIPRIPNIILCDEDQRIISSLFFYKDHSKDKEETYDYPNQSIFISDGETLTRHLLIEHINNEIQVRKQEKYRPLELFLHQKIKAAKNRIDAITSDVEKAKNNLKYKDYADEIFALGISLKKRVSTLEVNNTKVSLDPSKTIIENIEYFYKRAKRAKETINRSSENIDVAKEDLELYCSLLEKYPLFKENDLDKLTNELGLNKKHHETTETRYNKPYKVNLDGTIIYFGKNASQNDYLSFGMKLNKDFTWLHIKDYSGSHIIIASKNVTHEHLLVASELALINSHKKDGEVIYTLKKNIRKGKMLGEAIIKNHSTLKIKMIRKETYELFNKAKRI